MWTCGCPEERDWFCSRLEMGFVSRVLSDVSPLLDGEWEEALWSCSVVKDHTEKAELRKGRAVVLFLGKAALV